MLAEIFTLTIARSATVFSCHHSSPRKPQELGCAKLGWAEQSLLPGYGPAALREELRQMEKRAGRVSLVDFFQKGSQY
jgi:hypothetical protein